LVKLDQTGPDHKRRKPASRAATRRSRPEAEQPLSACRASARAFLATSCAPRAASLCGSFSMFAGARCFSKSITQAVILSASLDARRISLGSSVEDLDRALDLGSVLAAVVAHAEPVADREGGDLGSEVFVGVPNAAEAMDQLPVPSGGVVTSPVPVTGSNGPLGVKIIAIRHQRQRQ